MDCQRDGGFEHVERVVSGIQDGGVVVGLPACVVVGDGLHDEVVGGGLGEGIFAQVLGEFGCEEGVVVLGDEMEVGACVSSYHCLSVVRGYSFLSVGFDVGTFSSLPHM